MSAYWTRLKLVADINAGQSPSSADVRDLEEGGLPFLQGNAEFGALHPAAQLACETAPKRCRRGDILLSVRAPVGALNVADRVYGIGRGLCAITSRSVHPRYLWWTLQASGAHLASVSNGSTYDSITAEDVGSVPVRVIAPSDQMAMADYLDAEIARLDALVTARRLMSSLLGARLDQEISLLLDRPAWPRVPLKWLTRCTVGIVVRPSELYADSGFPCLRGFNVRPGSVSSTDLAYITFEGNRANAKSMLADGDIVVVRTGNAGAAAVVPSWAVGGNCVDLLLVRRPEGLQPRFLEAVLNSRVVRRQIGEGSVGALQAHFNTESLASLRVPVPTIAEQVNVMQSVDAARQRAAAMSSALATQVGLLQERRQALITAAVTGQIQIPGVAA